MAGLPNICIDPFVLSLPHTNTATKELVERYVMAMIDWARTADLPRMRAFSSAGVLGAIEAEGDYPWPDRLQSLLKHFELKEIDAATVASAALLLVNLPAIEDHAELIALVLEEGKTKVTPVDLANRLKVHVKNAFLEMLAVISMIRSGIRGAAENLALATYPVQTDSPTLEFVHLEAEVGEVQWKENKEPTGFTVPHGTSERVPAFLSREGLLAKLEPLSLWPEDDNNQAARSAIDSCCARLAASGLDGKSALRYSLGERFLESARQWQCGKDGRFAFTLIEACARIILNSPKNEVKPFTKRDSEEQRTRVSDGAKALRTHLTKKGLGLRLMLWDLNDGSIELANVGDKDDLEIL